jgi:hypothetical protein
MKTLSSRKRSARAARWICAAVFGALLIGTTAVPASAGGVHLSFGFGLPVYSAPYAYYPPTYAYAYPSYYAAPVYSYPAYGYAYSAPVWIGGSWGYGYRGGYHGHYYRGGHGGGYRHHGHYRH